MVDAKPGAGGNIASEHVSRAAPDGYTLILLTGGHAVSAALYKKLRFDPVDSFTFVSLAAHSRSWLPPVWTAPSRVWQT